MAKNLIFNPHAAAEEYYDYSCKDEHKDYEYGEADPYRYIGDAKETVPKSVDHIEYWVK